jgi:N12 class adenine-specific DNA methylase
MLAALGLHDRPCRVVEDHDVRTLGLDGLGRDHEDAAADLGHRHLPVPPQAAYVAVGLGKTLQVVALPQRLKEDGALDEARALVVVPTSLLTNWQKEIERFAPDLSVGVFHGARRELAKERPDVLLTTYGVARSETALLKAMNWRLVVVDEAQNIKA